MFILRRTVEDENSNTATDTITLTVRAAGVSPLAFSDWSPPAGSETRLLMLVSRGASNEWYRQDNSGSLIDDSNVLFDDLLAADLRVNRIRWNGSVFVLNRDGSGSFSDQLSGTDPPLGEGLLHVVTADGAITLAISLIAGIGDGFVSFRPTVQSVIDFLEGIGLGERFLFAFTIPGVTNTAPTISITTAGSLVDGAASVLLAGAVGDAEDDDGNVGLTVTASIGTITNLLHTGSVWTATWTAPAVTAAQQTATITATATDSGSLTSTATTSFMVRANAAPTVMITAPTSAQTVDGGDAIDLAATASAPEAGQTVTIAWTANIGTFTDSGGTTARWVAPAITNAVQTATITATATDALNETATDTLGVSVRANTAPSVSIDTSAQTVDGGGTLALTASVSDPEGQTLTHLWEITSGAGSITNSTSLSATLNLPAATTSVQTIAIRITTTDPLNLTGTDTVTITVRVADAVSLLVLSDFVAPDGTEIACSGLFTSGVPTNSGGVERLWGRIPRTPWGTLTDGDFDFDGVSINEIRRAANGSIFRLLKNGGTGFNTYFAVGGGGENARFYILTAEITISFDAVANILAPSGGNFFNFTLPDTAGWRSALSSIVAGDRFIMGWTVPSTAPDQMPTAPTIPGQSGTVGTALSYTLPLATGGDTPITTTADVLPGGLSLTNGVISGTPTAAGSTTVTITYTDNDGDTDTASFDFTVAPAADLMPVAPTIPDRTATVGSALSYTLPLATGGDAPVTTSADTLPAGLTLTSGVISGTPTATGTTTVTITYTDNDGDSDTASFDFVVSAAMAEVATLFIVDSSGDELWELANPDAPGTAVLRGNFPGGLTVPSGITSHNGSLFILDNTGDELWELADQSSPGTAVQRGDFPATLTSPRGITSHGGSLWIVDDSGDELWELADPSSPGTAVLHGEFPFSLSFSAALTSHGGSLFITDRSGGELWELADPSTPGNAVLRGNFPAGLTSQRGITSHGGSLWIVDDSGDELWELADPSSPGTAVLRGSFPTGLTSPQGITSYSAPAPDLMPIAPTIPDRTGTVGNAFSYTLPTATGGDAPVTTTADVLPAGLTLTNGVISGTPTTAGSTAVTIAYTDADGDSDTSSFDFVVAAADLMPIAPTIPDQTATVGTSYSQTLPVFSGGDGTLTYTAAPLPAGLNFNATTRLISGTPTTVETTTVVYEAEDDDGDTASVSFDISVGAADLLPTAAAIANQSATVGSAFSLTFDAATGGNTPLTYAVSGNPAWLTLSGRTLSGTPTATGTHTITITVTDSDGDTDTESFVLTVGTVPNTPPTISIATAAATVDGGQLVAIAGAVGDAEDDDGNVTVTVTASRGTISNLLHTGSGWMADWTAPAVTAAQQSAVITATAEDSDGLTATTTRTWTVRANQAPTVTIGTAGGDVTGGSTTTLTATASDPEGQTLTSLWEITSGPGTISQPTSLTGASFGAPNTTTSDQVTTVRITVTDTFGLTSSDSETFTVRSVTPSDAPDRVALPSVAVVSSSALRISYTAPASDEPITSYDGRYRREGTTTWTTISGIASPWNISGLTATTTYQVQVRARSSAGTGLWSPTATGTTLSASLRSPFRTAATNEDVTVSVRSPQGYEAVRGGLKAEAYSYSWSALGGPESCTVNLSGPAVGLRCALDWLGFTVMVSDGRGGPVWWGYVERVELADDAFRTQSALSGHYNSVSVIYGSETATTQAPTQFRRNARQADRYGDKELRVNLASELDGKRPSDEDIDAILKPFLTPARQIEHAYRGRVGVTLHCSGWVRQLDWRYVARYETGFYGNFGEDARSGNYTKIETGRSATDASALAWYGDFSMYGVTPPMFDQYLSRVRFLVRRDRTDTHPDVNFGIYGHDGGAPTTLISDNVGVTGLLPSDGGVTIDWADLVGTTTLLPTTGWYFVLSTSEESYSVQRAAGAHLAWPSTRPNGRTRMWIKPRTDPWDAHDGHPVYDFFTRLSAGALIESILGRHDRIGFLGPRPDRRQTFDAYLEGLETIGARVRRMAQIDDLYYTITPARKLSLFRATAEADDMALRMRANGQFVKPRRPGDLASLMGRWISYQGGAALCTGARYDVRQRAYSLSFRGVTSPGDAAQRVLAR